MSQSESGAKPFDVFLCHNSEDKPEIRQIAQDLKHQGIRPWLDEEEIRPGEPWQPALENQLKIIKSAAVFVGQSGLGPWQIQEIQVILNQFVNCKRPVIPVVLPSATATPELPLILQNLQFVDFRKTIPNPLEQLVWGVTGQKPKEPSGTSSSGDAPQSQAANLLPRRDKQVIEIRLQGNLESFSPAERDKVLHALSDLLDIGDVTLTRAPLAGSIRLRLELSAEDADKVYAAARQGKLAELGILGARLYPAIAVPPGEEQRAELLILLDRVNEQWVEGVLRDSLYYELLLSLGKRAVDEAVEPPWKHTVELASQRRHLPPQDGNISSVFDATGLLLILGDPGSGKTTTLLELASNLISRAKGDRKERVPVVLNLSGWKKRQPLTEWISGELSEKYRIPTKIARSWLTSDYLVPLLDGLDEVQTPLQPECVAAINEFIEVFKPSGLVVCCRLMEYQWLPERLKLNGAICLESLSSEEVNAFLTNGGPPLAGLQQAVNTDPVLQELSRTPLMLSIMSMAYQNRKADDNDLAEPRSASPKERQDRIFGLYVERMFQRKEFAGVVFPKDQVIGWLSWLAKEMKEHSQSVFMVEGLQPSWLGSKGQQTSYGVLVAAVVGLTYGLGVGLIYWLIYELGVGLIVGLIVGLSAGLGILLGCWSASPLKNGVVSGLIGGLTYRLGVGLMYGLGVALGGVRSVGLIFVRSFGLGGGGLIVGLIDVLVVGLIYGLGVGLIGGAGVGSLNRVEAVEAVSWNWKQFWKKTISGGLIFGLIFGLSLGLIFGLSLGLDAGLRAGLSFGLSFGLIVGLIRGLLGGMENKVRIDKTSPNEGIKLSGKNAAFAFLLGSVIVGLVFGLFWSLGAGQNLLEDDYAIRNWESFLRKTIFGGLGAGLIGGLSFGLNRGGSALVKHYSLRLILLLKGYTPFRFVELLDHCAKLILLKKTGGGYIFMHRMLLEYFAELNSEGLTGARARAEETTS